MVNFSIVKLIRVNPYLIINNEHNSFINFPTVMGIIIQKIQEFPVESKRKVGDNK